MLEKLRMMCNKYIELNKDNYKELKKYKLINEILSNDNCFLHMDVEYAYAILRDLKIPENDLKRIYAILISEIYIK